MIEKGLGAALPLGIVAVLILVAAFVIINIYSIKTKARIALADNRDARPSDSSATHQSEPEQSKKDYY